MVQYGYVRLPLSVGLSAMVQYFSLSTNQLHKSAQAAYKPAEHSHTLDYIVPKSALQIFASD